MPLNALSVQVHSEIDASLATSWNCRHWATGLGGHQAAHSRPSDRRRRTPDGRACCDDVVVRREGGSWKIKVAEDWQHPMWGGSSSRGTGEPCLGETGELSLRAYGGSAAEHLCRLSVKWSSYSSDLTQPVKARWTKGEYLRAIQYNTSTIIYATE